MEATQQKYPDVLLTGPVALRESPAWMPEELAPEIVPAGKLRQLPCLTPLTVVRAHGLKTVLAERVFLRQLAKQQGKTPAPAKIVFVFDGRSRGADAHRLLEVLEFFNRASDVEFVAGVGEAEFALREAVAKIWADPATESLRAADPLGGLKSVIAATKDLRAGSGRLSARRVAEAFGLSLNALAKIVGSTRQALFKTPDSPAAQKGLSRFERIARLRTLLAPDEFRAWLNMPSEPLGGAAPLELVRQGRVGVVADLAEDMLTGSPV